MKQYRITKYNPSHRDLGGAYLVDEWTSRSEIGKKFGGVLLTDEQYLSVEQAYLETAAAFISEAGVEELAVVGLENPGQSVAAPKDGSRIEVGQIQNILRPILRDEFWCKLECPNAFIHVGYDYYMYIGVPVDCKNSSTLARGKGLFVEPFSSPYAQCAA